MTDFCETFHGGFIYSQSFSQKSAERKSPTLYRVRQLILILTGMQINKIVALGAQKTRTHTLTSRCSQNESLFGADFSSEAQFGHFSSKMSEERALLPMALLIGPCWMNFCPQKLKRRILATFDFNRTAQHAIQLKLHSMFCALFLKFALWTAELMSFGHLEAVIWHRWTIICEVPLKISVAPTSQR